MLAIRGLLGLVLIAACLYAAVAVLAYLFQSSLIYPANQARIEPTGDYRAIILQTSDGLDLRAFYRSAEFGLPTIVYFHGNGGTLAGSMAANMKFAQAGYGLLLVNYRGYGGNPGSPSEAGFYRDGHTAMDWLTDQGVGQEDRIIAGNSIGGGTAVEMAKAYTPRALILSAPFTSLTDVASEKIGWLPVRWLLRDRFDNAAKIGDLSMPILIQHGTSDNLISAAHSRILAKRAPNATLKLFDGAGHDVAFLPESRTQRLRWVEALPD
ncbi:MAG: alpha/beta hydrolase [Pontixanthobacter sp.]